VSITRFDPYAQLTVDGKAVQIIKRTPADKDGGKDPIWQNEIKFDIVDQYIIDLKVFNQNITGKDTLLGFAEISLLPVFRNGQTEFWTSLKQKRVNGGIKEVGDIYLKLFFSGPVGIAYPQFRAEVDTFDDTLRKLPETSTAMIPATATTMDDDEGMIKQPISTIPQPDKEKPLAEQLQELAIREEKGREEKLEQEFTDEEIFSAFRFIDLDHNNFVGAAEIRHILVCMGEMITDEEIDMMISMVDLDGDGQVSYKEFRTLVLHPNPSAIDMHKEINKEKENELMKDKQALAGKNQSNDLESFQRQKELLQRENKKKFLLPFIVDNEITFDYLKQSFYDFLDLPKERRLYGKLKFLDFCKIMKIEPITEYKNMHSLYDNEETGELDLKEFLLSLMNFIPIDKELRVKFSFEMFDETKSGFITAKEIEEILRGNHMLSLNSIKRKAETVMRQAHTNESGAITLKEFIIISKKFPNILFPTSGITNMKKT
jgi:Ca2+-binding EF-hand superfamily protein